MSAIRRIHREFSDLLENPLPYFTNLTTNDDNIFLWTGLLVPTNPPYNKGAYKFTVEFPEKYPFKAPKVIFQTRMYHPNIDQDGNICMGILKSDSWKPATKVVQILEVLANIIDEPNINDPLDTDIANLYTADHKRFLINCEDHIKRYALKRPSHS